MADSVLAGNLSNESTIGLAGERVPCGPRQWRQPESMNSGEGLFPFSSLLRCQNRGQFPAGLFDLTIQPWPEFLSQGLECLLLFQDDPAHLFDLIAIQIEPALHAVDDFLGQGLGFLKRPLISYGDDLEG